jgi:hypothetical protein
MDFMLFGGGTAGLGLVLECCFKLLKLFFVDLHCFHGSPFDEGGYMQAFGPLLIAWLTWLVTFGAGLPQDSTFITILQNWVRI